MTDVKNREFDMIEQSERLTVLTVEFEMPNYYALTVGDNSGNDGGNDGDDSSNGDTSDGNDGGKTDGKSKSKSNDGFSTDGLEQVTLQGEENDYYLSSTGEVVDKEGKVKYSKEEYAKLSKSGNVDDVPESYLIVESDDFDEPVYLNEDKELVNAKGEVLKTAEEVAKLYDIGDDTDPFIKGVKETNLFPDLDNIEFSEEGVKTVITGAYDKGINKGKEIGINELKSKYPQLDDVLKHMELHGTDFTKYNQYPDYASIELSDTTSVGVLDSIVDDWHREKGIKKDNAYIQFLKNGDGYIDYVKGLKSELSDMVVQKKQARDAEIAKRNQARIDQANKYWGIAVDDKGNMIDLGINDSVYSHIVKNGEFEIDNERIEIPKVIRSNITGEPKEYSREDFFNWLYIPRPVEIDGKRVNATGYEIHVHQQQQSRTLSHDVLDAFTAFTNGDKSQLIKQSVSKHRKANKTIKLSAKGGSTSSKSTNKKVNVKPKMTIN